MRIFCISDVHIGSLRTSNSSIESLFECIVDSPLVQFLDFIENWNWITSLSLDKYMNDVLIIAGDITHEIHELEKFFAEVAKRFKYVSFVPGNHDLWLVKGDKSSKNSLQKFEKILALCSSYGIHTSPIQIKLKTDGDGTSASFDSVWIVPLFSWYHEDFDDDSSTKGERIRREIWCDYRNCKWPEEILNEDSETPSNPTGTPEMYFLGLNEPHISSILATQSQSNDKNFIISFSHFLPRRECFPNKEDLPEYRRFLPKVIGTNRLEEQLRKLGSNIHVFGHTHIPWNMNIDGVQYIQMCLKYPRERIDDPTKALKTIEEMLIFDSTIEPKLTFDEIEARRQTREANSK